MSVRDNLRYAAPDATDEQIRQAAYVSCVDDYVASLPDGLDTVLGDRGGKLSTGQRQRLSIARAIAKDAQILILDEPTAALDAATEHRVLERLDAWARGTDRQRRRAIFLITHRISTIRQAHRILYLDDGRIAEQGNHDELMAIRDGRYQRFVETDGALREGGGGLASMLEGMLEGTPTPETLQGRKRSRGHPLRDPPHPVPDATRSVDSTRPPVRSTSTRIPTSGRRFGSCCARSPTSSTSRRDSRRSS